MKNTHEEIKNILPDYIGGSLDTTLEKTIEAHLKKCSDCMEEFIFMSDLRKMKAPDPGDIYWETLPQKVRLLSTQKRGRRYYLRSLFRPVPAFATALLAVIVILSSYYIQPTGTADVDFLFEDPLAFSVIDIDGITEEDLPSIMEDRMEGDTLETYSTDDFSPYSYNMAFASLSSGQMESLLEALNKVETGGQT